MSRNINTLYYIPSEKTVVAASRCTIDLIFSLDIAKYFCPLLSYISVLRKFISLIYSYHTVFLALEIIILFYSILKLIILRKTIRRRIFLILHLFLNFPLKAIERKRNEF